MVQESIPHGSSPGVGQGHGGRVCALQKCGWHLEALLCAALGRGEFWRELVQWIPKVLTTVPKLSDVDSLDLDLDLFFP